MKIYDILLVSLPDLDKDKPSPGIFYLKSYLEANGKSVMCIDGNQYPSLDIIMLEIDKYSFDWLGVSVFSSWQIDDAVSFEDEYDKVVYGGGGVSRDWTTTNYIMGEGEVALLKFLEGDLTYPGVNGVPPKQIEDINMPPPDYTEIIKKHKYSSLVLTTSRGCVRKCTFCNVPQIWDKYKYISGETTVDNMIKVCDTTGIREISFSDSLINGSDREFPKMCKALIAKDANIRWKGQFIIKAKRTIEYFDMIKDSNCTYLTIGIESGSAKIRKDMNKHFSDEDMYWNIDMLLERRIKMTLLFIIGYPTETEEEFQESLDLLYKYKDHTDVIRISPHLMFMIDGAAIALDNYGTGETWVNGTNNYELRLRRFLEFYDYMDKYGYNITEYVEDKRREAIFKLDNIDKLELKTTWL